MATAQTCARLDWYPSAIAGTLGDRKIGSVPGATKDAAAPGQAASISVRAKSLPLNNSGSPEVLASA